MTIIELMVASGVMLVGLTALAYTTTVSFADIGTARQRQAANGLLNRTIEQVRALPFDTLRSGLDNADAAADTANVTVSGSTYTYKGNGEQIPNGTLPAHVTPLFPHVQPAITVGSTTYTVSTYPTFLPGSDQSAFRVTVVVTWPKLVRGGGGGRVSGQTIVYSPAGASGCLSAATHPFASPCQPFFYGASAVQAGGVGVSGTIQGINLAKASLHLSESSSNTQLEQVTAIQGYARTAGSTLALGNLADQSAGLHQVVTRATNDAAQPGADHDAQTYTAASANSALTTTGSGNTLQLIPGGSGDTASSVNTVTATASKACADPGGANQVDSQPCSNGRVLQGSPLVAEVTLTDGVNPLGGGPAQLASVQAPGTEAVSYTNRDLLPGTNACTATAGDGCMHAQSRRSIGLLRVAGLPAGMSPSADGLGAWAAGCRCLLELSNYSDRVAAESGGGSVAPAAAVAATDAAVSATPVLRYWNGSGYTLVTSFEGAPQTISVPPVTAASGSVVVTITANVVRTGGTSTSAATAPASAACPALCHTNSAAFANSPLVADIGYLVTSGGATIADLTISVDLGKAVAKASYQGAPSAG